MQTSRFLLLSVLAWSAAYAQISAGGSIRGRIADASGAIVPGAAVLARSPNVAGTFTGVSDHEGNYRLLDLPPATDYVVTAEKTGFSKFERKSVVVRAGLNIALDIDLAVGNVNQVVEVSAGDTPLLETVSTEQAINISGEMVRGLPLTGRREWSDTLQLTPGVLSASTDAYGGQVYFVRGSENENHATLLDGADIGSFQQNWPSNYIAMSTEALGDIQVKTGATDASSPSAMGMVINMATPTGGNGFHGAVALLASPRSWNANNTPGGISAVSDSLQPDFSFSGPIKKNKAWFFGSGRYIHRNDGISRTSTQLSRLLTAAPDFKPFDNEARGFIYAGNVTVQLSQKHKLFGLVQYDSRTQGGNSETYAGNFATNQYGGGVYALRLSSTWTPKLTSRFLIAYNNKGSNDSLEAIGGVGKLPSISVYLGTNLSSGRLVGNTNLATLNNLGSRSVSPAHKPTISGDVNYYIGKAAGSHEIQAGFYLQPKAATKSTTYYANNGFNSEDDVLRDPNTPGAGMIPFHRHYVDATGGLVTSYIGANDYAYYIQDRWRPFARLTITAGLRADWVSSQDWLFHVTTSHAWNYAPRVGGTYLLTKDHKNIVRANWGRVTDIPNASYFGSAGSSTAAQRDEYDLDLNGSFETVFTTPATSALATNRSIDPKRHQGYVQEWVVGYRRQLPGAFTFDASYITRDYKDRPAQVDINQIYNGNVWAGLVDPTQNNIYLITNNKWNWFVYQGIEFTATKQTSKIQFISTYTLAYDHIEGTWQPGDPASFIQPEAFANDAGIGTVRGNTTNSLTGDTRNRSWQHHQWRNGLTWAAPWKLRISNTFTMQSGIPTGPITTNLPASDPQYGPATMVIAGRTVSNPLATTYRFVYANRGDGQLWTPWLTTWNTRFGRVFDMTERTSVEIGVDVFNITNRGAAQQPLSSANQINSANYGGFQNIQTPRAAQVSARWRF
jgi:hypothetical protein